MVMVAIVMIHGQLKSDTIALMVMMAKMMVVMANILSPGALQIASAVPGLMGSVSTGSMPDSDRNTPVS